MGLFQNLIIFWYFLFLIDYASVSLILLLSQLCHPTSSLIIELIKTLACNYYLSGNYMFNILKMIHKDGDCLSLKFSDLEDPCVLFLYLSETLGSFKVLQSQKASCTVNSSHRIPPGPHIPLSCRVKQFLYVVTSSFL